MSDTSTGDPVFFLTLHFLTVSYAFSSISIINAEDPWIWGWFDGALDPPFLSVSHNEEPEGISGNDL